MTQLMKRSTWFITCLLMALLGVSGWLSTLVAAQDAPVEEKQPVAEAQPAPEVKEKAASVVAKYVTVTNPVNEVMFTRVRNALVSLQQVAEQEDRSAVLVLELERGTTTFGQARDLAKELTSAKYAKVRTVAWIPQHPDGRKLDGYVAIVALACQDIVMHPDAEMGDIGRGNALESDEQQFVINLVEKRYNAKLNGALATGFVDPSKAILKLRLDKAGDQAAPETRIATQDELRRLQESKVPILAVETIKEQRDVFVLTGKRAKALDIVISHTATDRGELSDLFHFERQMLREEIASGTIPKAKIIKLEGMIEPMLHSFADREIDRALSEGVNVLIFEIDSPGGFLLDSEELADRISLLDPKKVRTIAYVPKGAYSGAAIIAMGCDDVILHPDAKIGDAGPIEMRAGEQFERAPEKVLSPLRTTLRQLGERKGRPPAILEAMADKDLEVFQVTHRENGRVWFMSDADIQNANGEWVKGPLVPESRAGNLLTVDGRRAHAVKIAGEPVNDLGELKARLSIPKEHELPVALQTWVDTTITVLNHPAMIFFLFVVGIMCIYLEAYTQTGFFGIGAALCFVLYFWSHFLGGTAGWLEVVLFLFGVALILLEIFVVPGFGVFGITGGLAVIASLILASQTFVIPRTEIEFNQLSWTMGTLSGSIIVVGVLAVVMGRFIPQLPGIRSLILAPPGVEDEEVPLLDPSITGASEGTSLLEQDRQLVGSRGVAFSILRPSGKAQINGRLVDVVSDGAYIEPGSELEVISVTGNRIVVRSIG